MRNRSGFELRKIWALSSLIHRSAWKGNSQKSLCSILYREARAQPITLLSLVLRTGSEYDILYGRIKMRWRGYIAFAYPKHTLVHMS